MGQMPLGWSMILLVRNAFQASPDLCYLASGQKIWEVLPEVNWMAWYQITPFIAGKPTLRHAFLREYFYVSALKWKAVLKAVTRCYHGYAENTGISDSVFLFTNTVITNNEFSGHFISSFWSEYKQTICNFYLHILRQLVGASHILLSRLWNYVIFLKLIGLEGFFFLFCFCSFVWQLSPNLAFWEQKKESTPSPISFCDFWLLKQTFLNMIMTSLQL